MQLACGGMLECKAIWGTYNILGKSTKSTKYISLNVHNLNALYKHGLGKPKQRNIFARKKQLAITSTLDEMVRNSQSRWTAFVCLQSAAQTHNFIKRKRRYVVLFTNTNPPVMVGFFMSEARVKIHTAVSTVPPGAPPIIRGGFVFNQEQHGFCHRGEAGANGSIMGQSQVCPLFSGGS